MKLKSIVTGLMIFGWMNTQATAIMDLGCEQGDWLAPNSHECVYCAGDLFWTKDSGLTCMVDLGKKCGHGTGVNLSKHGYCVYCSEGYSFDKIKGACLRPQK